MQSGRVKWFNDALGYGFLESRRAESDILVHQSVIRMKGYRTLTQGQQVSYDAYRHTDGRLRARIVVPLSWPLQPKSSPKTERRA